MIVAVFKSFLMLKGTNASQLTNVFFHTAFSKTPKTCYLFVPYKSDIPKSATFWVNTDRTVVEQ